VFLEECRDELLDRVIRHERRALERLVRRGRGPAARREPLFDRYTLIGMAVADAQDRVFHYFTRDAAAEVFRQLPYTHSSVGLPDSGSGPMLYQWTKLCRALVGSAMRLLFGCLPRKTAGRKKSLEKPVFQRILLEVSPCVSLSRCRRGARNSPSLTNSSRADVWRKT
jgi:hypothetical protein